MSKGKYERSEDTRSKLAASSRRTHCKRGHLLEGDNVIETMILNDPNRRGLIKRNCRACIELKEERYRSDGTYRANHLWQKYKITPEQYEEMFADQNGECMMCHTTLPRTRGGKHLAIDHDHASGLIRDLLCGTCNTGLGHLKHDPELLRAGIELLERWREWWEI